VSTIDQLAATQNGRPDAISATEELGAIIDLPAVHLEVTGGRIVGRGGSASGDLYLSDGSAVTFESLLIFGNPRRLALEIAATTGAQPKLDGPRALRALVLFRALAEHQETFTADQIAADWGVSYLQAVETVDVE
jgi:hypothetical protein